MGLALENARLERCLDAIYDATVASDGWQTALAELALIFGAGFVDICSWTHDRRHVSGLAHGLDADDYQANLLGFWFNRNVWSQRRPVQSAGEVLSTRQMVDREDLCRSEMYQEYLNSRGLHEGLRLSLWVDDQGLADISLLRPWSQGAFGATEIEIGRALLPHLQRAARLSRRLREAEFQLDAGSARPDGGKIAAIAFDAQGAAFWLNAAAMAMAARGHVFQLSGQDLSAASPEGTERLKTAVGRAVGRVGPLRQASSVRLATADGSTSTTVVVQPLSNRNDWALPRRPAALAVLRVPAAGLPQIGKLQQLFGLTGAEAQMALDLLAGLTLSEAASRKGLSRNTTRTHLSRLMEKTGTTRQVDLVRLLKDVEAVQF